MVTVHQGITNAMRARGIDGVVLSPREADDVYQALINWAGACPEHHNEAMKLLSLFATEEALAVVDRQLRRLWARP